MFRILAIDGGGIKGVFPASFLTHIEGSIGTDAKIADYFDLIAGTSTGGIIALGLGLGFSAKEMLGFYELEGPRIFVGRVRKVLNRYFGASKYNTKELKRALTERFSEKLLSDSCKPLLIPAFDVNRGGIHIFKTRHNHRLTFDHKVRAVDVALATTAAPTYFGAHRTAISAADGGLWANNPSALAVTEAISMLDASPTDIHILSIGCTDEGLPTIWRYPKFLFWAKYVADFMCAGQSFAAIGTCQHLLDKKRVVRINPAVRHGRFALDNVSQIRDLAELGYATAREEVHGLQGEFFREKAEPTSWPTAVS